MKRNRWVVLLLLGLCMLFGCAKDNLPSSNTGGSSSKGMTSPSPKSSAASLPPDSSSGASAVSGGEAAVPKTTDTGERLFIRPAELLALNEFLNMTIATCGSFEYGQPMDNVLITSGMCLCFGEGEEFPDGESGVKAKAFEQIVYEYFGRHIESPQKYEDEQSDDEKMVRYDGEYYRWYGMGLSFLEIAVGSVEDLGNGFMKCIATGIWRGDYEVESGGVEEKVNVVCIVRKAPDSRYKYNLLASRIEE